MHHLFFFGCTASVSEGTFYTKLCKTAFEVSFSETQSCSFSWTVWFAQTKSHLCTRQLAIKMLHQLKSDTSFIHLHKHHEKGLRYWQHVLSFSFLHRNGVESHVYYRRLRVPCSILSPSADSCVISRNLGSYLGMPVSIWKFIIFNFIMSDSQK